jgi:hypothetical protein
VPSEIEGYKPKALARFGGGFRGSNPDPFPVLTCYVRRSRTGEGLARTSPTQCREGVALGASMIGSGAQGYGATNASASAGYDRVSISDIR